MTYTSPKVTPYRFNGDLRSLPIGTDSHKPAKSPDFQKSGDPVIPHRGPYAPDPVWQRTPTGGSGTGLLGLTSSTFTTPNPNFDTNQPGDGPPDDNGAVGPNHYIGIVNFTYQVFDKQGNSLAGPTDPKALWASAPATDQCKNLDRGDPYVNYDHLADRWVISFFSNEDLTDPGNAPNLKVECIAVSQGPNPVTDGWYVYTFHLGFKNDYPKIAVWPDGYYSITQRGYDGTSSLDAVVFDRQNMLNGNPASFQRPASEFPSEHDVIALPSDLTGPAPPPGSPNFYARAYDGNLYSDGVPRIEIFEFHTDWGIPANSTFGLSQTISVATFRSDICSGSSLNQYCVPQPGVTDKLDALSIWPMGPLQYRNFGTYETLVFNHTVNADGAGLAGIRWYELRRTPAGTGSWVLQQQGTFAPADSTTTSTASIYRWTGSIAMDKAGNIAMGYNVSNDGDTVSGHPTVYPGVRLVGRLATDPSGQLTTPEVHAADGGGTKSGGSVRWGDYSAIRVDPVDGCTFWYTTMYIAAGNSQKTRVSAARFDTCNPANLKITKTGPGQATAGNQIIYTVNVKNNGTSDATNVAVTDTLPTGVTYVTSSIACNLASQTLTCNIGNLANGASTSFTITVKIPANFLSASHVSTKDITNTATVTATELDPDTSDNTSSVVTSVVESADVRITKSCKPDAPASAGTPAYCDLTISNLGVSDAQNVVATDALISNSQFVVTSYTPPGACTPGTPSAPVTSFTATCNLGTLAANATTTIRVNVQANTAGDINDTATVSSSTPDPNTSNNLATGKVSYVSSADLSITKTSSPNPAVAGTNFTYTITASNAGPSAATNVVVNDTLPGQISVVSVTPSVGSCSGGIPGNPAQPLICTIGTLNVSASATITVVVKIDPAAPQGTILVNNASITSSTPDPNNANNVASANTTVNARADLSIVKTSDQPNYKPNALITFTIKVTNNGPSNALAVIAQDNLPSVAQALYLSDTGGCTKSGLVLTCNLGDMPTGTSKSFNVLMTVKGNRGTITNNATVTSSTVDPATANNSATLNIGVK